MHFQSKKKKTIFSSRKQKTVFTNSNQIGPLVLFSHSTSCRVWKRFYFVWLGTNMAWNRVCLGNITMIHNKDEAIVQLMARKKRHFQTSLRETRLITSQKASPTAIKILFGIINKENARIPFRLSIAWISFRFSNDEYHLGNKLRGLSGILKLHDVLTTICRLALEAH